MIHAVLLYDSDCGFCRWLVDKVLLWDRRGRVKSMELQDGFLGDRKFRMLIVNQIERLTITSNLFFISIA